jgi:hypothetical protein
MKHSRAQEPREGRYWRRAAELPGEVFAVLRKPDRAINPVTIVATVDPDGAPRTAPFGSLRAVTPRLLRLVCWRRHDTYTNFSHDGRVMVVVLAPPNIAVSIRGRARVARERMTAAEQHAVVEIDVEEVKNDMVRGVVIESPVTVSVLDERQDWFEAVLRELEGM